MSVRWTLDPVDLYLGALEGICRTLTALAHGYPGQYGASRGAFTQDVHGTYAEIAAARWLRRHRPPQVVLPPPGTPDIAPKIQVRHTPRPGGHLLLHKADPPDHVFLLVTGLPPVLDLPGCLRAVDGQDPRYWGDPYATGRPAYWVPQADLWPLWWLPPDA